MEGEVMKNPFRGFDFWLFAKIGSFILVVVGIPAVVLWYFG